MSRKSLSAAAKRPLVPIERKPLPRAIGVALLATGLVSFQPDALAQRAFSPQWFAQKGAVQGQASATGLLPDGRPANLLTAPRQQSDAARARLQTSIDNLTTAAQAIALQQSLQRQARDAALLRPSSLPDGLGEGGLKIDDDALTRGWANANAPVQSSRDGRVVVDIEQTADKAVLNWETFNVGGNTTLNFAQQSNWSVLNRVNDPNARPSQIQGQINAPGSVFVLNRNGILFDGSSQVNVRNLVASAVGMSDAQFAKGLYGDAQGSSSVPTFGNDLLATTTQFSHAAATGSVVVAQGAQIASHAPASVNEGGGYVMLLGKEVHNAGHISTPNGQAVLAAGDAFTIRKGLASDANQTSTTRGNVVDALRLPGTLDGDGGEIINPAGLVRNTGLVQASTGDIRMVGHDVRQDGALLATTSVHVRGTVHLLSDRTDANGKVTLGEGSATAIVLDESATTALDVQRETLVQDTDKAGDGIQHRRDQSLLQISSGGEVDFEGGSLSLATGGQVHVDAVGTTDVQAGARIDVSGHVGVQIAMEANNVLINVQGNEQRDAPVNRDGDQVRGSDIWVDRRDLVLVPAGTNGYESDRWYTAGGLLEVGGYLGITGHGIGEWSAQGGTVQFLGGNLLTRQGSSINLSGGTLDVQTGYVRQTWLKAADGLMYKASNAPGDVLYTGLYKGFESSHERWGDSVTEYFFNPLISPQQRLENGYTVGRDAGRLVVSTRAATLEGDVETTTFQGDRQINAPEAALDGYRQSQTAVARRGELVIGDWRSVYDAATGNLRFSPGALVEQVVIGAPTSAPSIDDVDAPVVDGDTPQAPTRITLGADWINELELGALRVHATGSVQVEEAFGVVAGGEVALHATQVDVAAGITARGGRIALGNAVQRHVSNTNGWQEVVLAPAPDGYDAGVHIGSDVTLDARGAWNNQQLQPQVLAGLPWVDGGDVSVRSTGSVSLEAGAVVDVSSGATLASADNVRGGRGGDIALVADALDGLPDADKGSLLLDGELRGHGVKGGGTLHLQTGGVVVLGGQVAGSDGVLREGEASLAELVTAEDFTIGAGAVLPVDYHYTRVRAAGGEALGGQPQVSAGDPSSWITVAAPWTLPKPGNSNLSYDVTLADGRFFRVQAYDWSAPVILEAGAVVTQISYAENFPAGYVLPADAVPGGIALVPTAGVRRAGSIAEAALTFAAGTRIAAGARLPQAVAVEPLLHLDGSMLQQGFSHYEITGLGSVAVAEGADLQVAMPVLRMDPAVARGIDTGADPRDALQAWLPPGFVEDPMRAELSQRDGADLVLTAGGDSSRLPNGETPSLVIGEGARISVDAGHSINLRGNGQITIDGTLQAAGGRIGVQGLGYGGEDTGHLQGHDRSIWIGGQALLDVSGVARTGVDALGRRYGTVLDGGRIEIGGDYTPFATRADAVDNFVVIRPGARLLASGAAATLDLPGLGATGVASDGGVIHLASFNGLYQDGTLEAAAGGAGAAGGTLSLALEAPNYLSSSSPADRVLVHRELELVQVHEVEALADDLAPGQADPALVYGRARIGADRVQAGGFDNLSLLVNGFLSLHDGVDLALGQGVNLAARAFGLAEGTLPGANVSLAAPYVRLSGTSRSGRDGYVMPYPAPPPYANPGRAGLVEDSHLQVEAGVLDIRNFVTFGGYGYARDTAAQLVQRDGFELVELRSEGDMRLLMQDVGDRTQLATDGDLVLAASQIYPTTSTRAEILAGRTGVRDQWDTYQVVFDPERSLRIERAGDALPAVPFSAFGSLLLHSANIDQGGVLRAPLGSVDLGYGVGSSNEQQPGSLVLRPGSVTSVSAAGLAMPYGGTVDGLTYGYDGSDAYYRGLGALAGQVQLAAGDITVEEGALVDLSGGGELSGAGFLTGRGGSTDARLHPLVQMAADGSGFVLPGLASNAVYAIVPGTQPVVAPVAGENGAGDPVIGRQISIGDGVPGLAAGTYTLLPSTYALQPGAFRVELNGLASSSAGFGETIAMRNGSLSTAARLGIANTDIADVQTTQVVLTAADTLRTYSQYNETSYADFGLDWARRDGVPRPQLERDARQLLLTVGSSVDIAAGSVDLTATEGGRGGTAVVVGRRVEILADGSSASEDFDGISIHASTLNGLGAAGLSIGGAPSSVFSQDAFSGTKDAWQVLIGSGGTDEIIIREGATLRAAQVLLSVSNREQGLMIEQGAGIDTLGRGAAPWDSTEGFVLVPGTNGVLALSNGWLDILPSAADQSWGSVGAGYLHIGVCAEGATCSGDTRLYAEGTITAATNKSFLLDESVRYGARNLVLAMGAINVGSASSLAQAGSNGLLPDGLTLNQGVLDRLLRGDTSTGAPALENLVLTARDSVNFFGNVDLSTIDPLTGESALERLVLTAPAIRGLGGADDVARIATDTLVWNGGLAPAGDLIAGGAGSGSGRFVVDARQIEFGYGPRSQPNTVAEHERMTLGFAGVELNASERITANHKGSLAVYQQRDGWDAEAMAWRHSGGDLHISTPLLTGDAGSVNRITAGGSIIAVAPDGAQSPVLDADALSDALGAELHFDAGTRLSLDTSVVLPSGKLQLSAGQDLLLQDGASLDLAGRRTRFFDVDTWSWGGELLLDSRSGNVRQLAGSTIDISADNNRAGRVVAKAMQGTVALDGSITGESSGRHDAGGTQVTFAAGSVEIGGRHIDDFAGLNARLNEGGVSGGRSFQLGEGDLVIGDELKAREINVSVDNGSLRVEGTVDASGEQAGSIRLAANEGITLAGTAVLDASASVARADSYGQLIDAPNRAVIEIDSGNGRLVLQDGVRMDLGVDGAAGNFGTVALNAPRLGGATNGDIDIDASGRVDIVGARSIAVNAFQRYDDARVGEDADVDGRSYQVVDQAYVDAKHADSVRFIDNALRNGELMDQRLRGLRTHAGQFHLRPGVEIASNAAVNPDGGLHVDGDIDLSGHRYASVNTGTALTGVHGSGEAGALVLRAAGDLSLFGSITDGFDTSRLQATGDDAGWVLAAGRMLFGADLVIPQGGKVILDTGTVFKAGRTLNYDLPVAGLTLPAGTLLPSAMPLAQALTLPAGSVLGADVLDASGVVLHAAGTLLQQPLTLEAGQQLAAGFRLPEQTQVAATLWPRGVALPMSMTLAAPLALAKGALLPSETDVLLAGGVDMVELRPADAAGNHGRNLAVAPMLASGSQSWDMRLVAGADMQAADTRATSAGGGSLRLADTHFGLGAALESTYQFALDAAPDFLQFLADSGIPVEAGQPITPELVELFFAYGLIWDGIANLNEYGYGDVVSVLDSTITMRPARQQLFSVLRTGTGDLDLVSSGDVDMTSPYGVYTAGTNADTAGPAYDLARARLADGTILQAEGAVFEGLVDGGADSLYQAWYPHQGGNVLLRAGGDLKGDLIGNNGGGIEPGYAFGNSRQQIGSTAVGTWLWRQGSGDIGGADAVASAWWINFGTYIAGDANGNRDDYNQYLFGNDPFLVGFTGVGTLGGGNLTVQAAGDAGMIDQRGQRGGAMHNPRSQGLHLVVASTGRVDAAGNLLQTGGGDLDLRLGGRLNPDTAVKNAYHDLNSTFVNLRGATRIDAGAIGGIELRYGTLDQMDSRSASPFTAGRSLASGGPVLVLGDSSARIDTRGDLVLGGAADPGRTTLLSAQPFSHEGTAYSGNGWSWFSLWTPATAISLFSAGGNLTPTTAWDDGGGQEDVRWGGPGRNQSANGDGHFYPSILRAAAANGSLFYGASASGSTHGFSNPLMRYGFGLTLAPSPLGAQFNNATGQGELQLLAGDSIHAAGYAITASTADPAGLSSPLRPGFVGMVASRGGGQYGFDPILVYTAAEQTLAQNDWIINDNSNPMQASATGGRMNVAPLFTFATPATSAHAVAGRAPARYYAVDGDVVGLRMGQEVLPVMGRRDATRYEGSVPVAIRAGRDITDSGTPLGQKDTISGRRSSVGDTRGNLIAHAFGDDISVVEAGRDVRNSSFYVVGPGLLDVSAGRDVYLADNGEFKSLGPVVNVTPGDRSSGAGISVSAGMGEGARWDEFADRYLDPANQADLVLPFADQPGKALTVYGGDLTMADWLRREFGYSGDEAGAATFMAGKQAELDATRQQALAEGRSAANRALSREYRVESQLHLVNWLGQRFAGRNGQGLHFDAESMDARTFFDALPMEQRRAYLRNVYYAELRAGGREYTNPDSARFTSYLRGREAVATLFPQQDADGRTLAYDGDLTMFSSALYHNANIIDGRAPGARPTPGVDYLTKEQWVALGSPMYNASYFDVLDAGIHTNFGGDIQILTPGGRTLVGVDGGFNPGPGSGVMTQGEGDISIYAQDDILMGQSRIFTTFGGNILAWSAEGDINAGRGSKTTVVYAPLRRVYDDVGNVALSPSTPNTGAGIATLNPIPEIPPGDIDLIAPLGTIDAGEAGIRVSGQVNLAALQVLNADNIQVQGEATGLPVIAAVNISALTSASAAANSAVEAAQDMVKRQTQQARPSVISVEVLGFGDRQARATPVPDERGYRDDSVVQVIGSGGLTGTQLSRLTDAERKALQ